MARTTLIYTLAHPETGEVRYVGKTIGTLARRLVGHQGRQGNTAVSKWVHSLRAKGLTPEIALLTTAGAGWADVERFWIAKYRAEGYRLLNILDGGDGSAGFRHSDDTRRKIAAAGRRPCTPEARAKIAASLRGRSRPPEVIAKLSAAAARQFAEPEARRQASLKTTAYYSDPAARAAMSEACKTRPGLNAASRARLSASLLKHYSDPANRAALAEKKRAAR